MTTMVLRRVSVLSVATWVALPLAVMGVFAGVIYGLSLLHSGQVSLSLAIFYFVSLPIEYAFVGFVGTATTGLIYNSVAKRKGGIVLQFEMIPTEYDSQPVDGSDAGRRTEVK